MNGMNKMNISIIGTGYVGLVTGTCLVDFFIVVGTPSNDDGSANQVPPSSSYPSPFRGEHQFKTQRRIDPSFYKQYKGESQ